MMEPLFHIIKVLSNCFSIAKENMDVTNKIEIILSLFPGELFHGTR